MEKTSYNKKYKDRDPKETIKIIKDFFESKGFTLKEEFEYSVDSKNICRVCITLYYNNIPIQTSAGKGTSKEFCLASGYAEMFELFNCKNAICCDYRLLKRYQQNNYDKYGYYWAPDEKLLTLDQLLEDKKFQNVFNVRKIKEYHEFFDFQLDSKYIGLPFKSIFDSKDVNYYNPFLLEQVEGTNGLATGNTLEEALVQGISELFERDAITKLIPHRDDVFYQILNTSLTNTKLKSIIEEIEDTNKTVKIFDLSYNFDTPVVMILIIDNITHDIYFKFGANPVFDIALERCLTEIYQFRNILDHNFIDSTQFTAKALEDPTNWADILYGPKSLVNIIPEQILTNAVIKDTPSIIFLQENFYSNTELLEHIKTICKNHNINIYYRDYSMIPELVALSIYSPNLDVVSDIFKFTILEQIKYLTNIKDFYTNFNIEPSNNIPNRSLFGYFCTDVNTELFDFSCLILNLLALQKVSLIKSIDALKIFYTDALYNIYKPYIAKYATLYRYRVINKLSFESAQDLANTLNFEFSKEDWDICLDIKKLCKYVLTPAFNEIFSENILNEIINKF